MVAQGRHLHVCAPLCLDLVCNGIHGLPYQLTQLQQVQVHIIVREQVHTECCYQNIYGVFIWGQLITFVH